MSRTEGRVVLTVDNFGEKLYGQSVHEGSGGTEALGAGVSVRPGDEEREDIIMAAAVAGYGLENRPVQTPQVRRRPCPDRHVAISSVIDERRRAPKQTRWTYRPSAVISLRFALCL